MDNKIYYGNINTSDLANSLIANFNRGNYRAQQVAYEDKSIVQIATHQQALSGGQTALTVNLQKVEDGISVSIGQQAWFGIAASLGSTVLQALHNPLSLLGRLDDIAQDIESIQLTEEIWRQIDKTAQTLGAGQELSERLRRITCAHCGTANPVGESNCIACGAPLGESQPRTCPNCGYAYTTNLQVCPNCSKPLL